MFPVPSPNSQAIFAQLAGGPSATPGTIDFHRTALSAAAAKREQAQAQQQPPPVAPTSQPQETANGTHAPKTESKPPTGPFDPHDNDAANGLFLLAQGRNTAQPAALQQYAAVPPAQVQTHTSISAAPAVQPTNTSSQMNGAPSLTGSSARGVSEASARSDESEVARPNTRARKRNSGGAAAGSRRKTEETQTKAHNHASKKQKTSGGGASVSSHDHDMDHSDDDDHDKSDKEDGTGSKSKMTDEEKRKNFLERNRYVFPACKWACAARSMLTLFGRVAALKCRQRKKQWLANLQSKVELFSSENEALTAQIGRLREEVVNLKTLLLAHKDCPMSQQQGLHTSFLPPSMEAFNPSMNPYGMAPPMGGQPVMAGQGIDRRFS
jgi:ATF/CREB family transcription factor